jgi:hypothetical protein
MEETPENKVLQFPNKTNMPNVVINMTVYSITPSTDGDAYIDIYVRHLNIKGEKVLDFAIVRPKEEGQFWWVGKEIEMKLL